MKFTNNKRYNDFSSFIKRKFGERVQKVSLDTGFTCPNRDGSKGTGGCTYCNNNTFSPYYCKPKKSITQQLDIGIDIFSEKYKTQKYLAYFQSYTNTYADISLIKELYSEAINHPKIIGLVIGTRPDCIDHEIIDYLSEISKKHYVVLEFGVESTLNRTLKAINRCHSYEETIGAFKLAENKGLHLGAHIILGLPGETPNEMLNHAIEISKLPIHSLKIHHLQIVKNTVMALQYQKNPEFIQLFNADDYIDFITRFITLLRPNIIIERFISESPAHLLIAPKWGLKNFEFVAKIDKRLIENDLWQGKHYNP